jgi:hemoglobin
MSLYDEVGGAAVISSAVAILYRKVLDDPEVHRYFVDVDLGRLRVHQSAFLNRALGGPQLFAGHSLGDAHERLDIDDTAFDAVIRHLVEALRELNVREGTIRAVAATIEPLRSQVVSGLSAPVDR